MKKALVPYLFVGAALVVGYGGYKVHNRIVNRFPPDWNRNLAEPAPAPNLRWTRCAADGERCEFDGTARVRYGANGKYAYRTASYFIECSAAAFGKKEGAASRACEYASDTFTTPNQAPDDPASPVALENRRAGTAAWHLRNPALAGEIEGYASLTSVAPGGSIDFLVNTDAASFDIDVFRMGYYGGLGARLMTTVTGLPGNRQVKPCLRDGVVECDWQVSHTLAIPAADPGADDYWTSGVYLARLRTADDRRKDSYILFVVRDDRHAARYVAQLPVTTYQAYNLWGGKSLYTGCYNHDKAWACPDGAEPSHTVSFNRPYGRSANPLAAYGVGAGEFLTNVQPIKQGYPISSAAFDYNMVRWMERRGYDVGYISNLDLHARGDFPEGTRAILSIGHDEYYSRDMRDHLVAARDAGVNLGFFSSNQVYWQVRFVESAFGSHEEKRNMICYKREQDPVTDPRLTTGTFRSMGEDEARFMGAQYVHDPVMSGIAITNPGHWLYAGTGAAYGTVLNGLLGYEVNAIIPGTSPANVVSLARTRIGPVASDMSYYIAPSGAQVFGTGSMQWSWGLDDYISNGVRPDYRSTVAQRITDNVFRALGERGLHSLQANDGGYLSATGDGQAAIQRIGLAADASGLEGQWRMLDAGSGGVRIVSRANGRCLDAFGARAGSAATAQHCDGLPEQRWQVRKIGGDAISLSNSAGSLCLTAEPGAGAAPTLQACTGGGAQRWKLSASGDAKPAGAAGAQL